MRLFVGIPLAVAAIGQLAAISKGLRTDGDGLRWSTPESWHITLQFLGNANQQQYECVAAGLRGVHVPRFPIEMNSMGVFDRAGIFFAGVKLTPELLSLQQHVTASTELCGFVREERPYHPHVTLARTRGRGKAEVLSILKTKIRRQPSFTRFIAEEFILYESITMSTGSHYEIRERFVLYAR